MGETEVVEQGGSNWRVRRIGPLVFGLPDGDVLTRLPRGGTRALMPRATALACALWHR